MKGLWKTTPGVLVARPLIAIAIEAVVVGLLLLHSHRQKTPVTHRVQHVELTDQEQMQLGNQQYAKTLRDDRARIVSSGPDYAQVQRVARRIEVVAARDKPQLVWKAPTATRTDPASREV